MVLLGGKMDWLTFLAEVIKALAWPVTVVILLLLLRKPISDLIPLLQHLKYKDLELDFGKKVQELIADMKKELPGNGKLPDTTLKQRLSQLSQSSPRAAILEAWLELEEVALEALKRKQFAITSQDARSPLQLGHALLEAGILDQGKHEIYNRLRNLRNSATHASEFPIGVETAIDYAEAATRLAEYIKIA
jgi:hypothetical protein